MLRAVALLALAAPGAPFAVPASRRTACRPRSDVRRSAATMNAVTPAIARARISTQEEQIRHLEKELVSLKAAVVAGKRELLDVEKALAPSFRETTSRSLVKAFGWRVTAGFITFCSSMYFIGNMKTAFIRAAKESEIPNFKGSYLGRFPLVSAGFWTSDHLSERSRSVDVFSGTRARGTLTLKLL
jgi:hypothetical protein